jgi:hypothetical protein
MLGTYRVWQSLTGGIGQYAWQPSSPDLTKNTLIVGSDNRSFINRLSYATSDVNVGLAGTSDGNVWYGFSLNQYFYGYWIDVTGGNQVLPNRPIQGVTTDPTNPLIGYATIAGFDENTPATPGHLFRIECTAFCASYDWSDKSGNLPDIPANAVIVNPHDGHQVFVGTDWGLYFTDDIEASPPQWQRFEGLPHVMIWDMTVDRGFTTLAVFTRSRGAWVWPLPFAAGAIFRDGFED